jgi:hypothetical protein
VPGAWNKSNKSNWSNRSNRLNPGTRHPAPGTRHPAPGTRHYRIPVSTFKTTLVVFPVATVTSFTTGGCIPICLGTTDT